MSMDMLMLIASNVGEFWIRLERVVGLRRKMGRARR